MNNIKIENNIFGWCVAGTRLDVRYGFEFLCRDLCWYRSPPIDYKYYSSKEKAEAILHKWRLRESGNSNDP